MINRTLQYSLLALCIVFMYACGDCNDNIQNGSESGVDCGGNCPPCVTCTDNIKNGNEIGIDCGGDCSDCFPVNKEKELLIRNTVIVDSESAKSGVLSFGQLITRLASSESQQLNLAQSFIDTWQDTVEVNGINILPRPGTKSTIVKLWSGVDSEAITGADLTKFNEAKTPFRLLAVNSRFDLADFDKGKVGEGRLTYGLTSGTSRFTMIFECNLEGNSENDRIAWMNRFHQLSNMEFNEPQFLDTLEAIVTTFSKSSAQLSQMRTNEFLNTPKWEFREFKIKSGDGLFHEVTRKANPTSELEGDDILLEYIDVHGGELGSMIRDEFNSRRILAGNTLYDGDFMWEFSEATPEQQVHLDTLNMVSCMSCHGGLAPGTGFTHIKPRQEGRESELSPFLKGDLENRVDTIRNVLGLPPSAEELKEVTVLDAQRIDSIKILLNRLKGVKRVH